MKHLVIALVLTALSGQLATPRLYRLDEMRWPEIDALNRERTLFILAVGMIEQHGPHLPVGADTLGVTDEANAAALRAARALPQWNVVVMPPINYGHAGANEVGGKPVHPGTYGIRQSTLRALVADVGAQVAQNGFKWIFVINGHAAPTHNVALDQACDFVSDTYGVSMLHLTALFRGDATLQERGREIDRKFFSAAELSALGLDVHAGVSETSQTLAVRPQLVAPNYRSLPSRSGATLEELSEIAMTPGWQGYFSAPARATAAHGRAIKDWWIAGFTELIVRSVGGENMRERPRVPGSAVPPQRAPLFDALLEREAVFASALETWLKQRTKQ